MRRLSFLEGVHNLDPKDFESSVKYWDSKHFLDGIRDPILVSKCAISYTRLAQYVFGPEEPCTATAIPGLDLDVSSLPLVRRVVCETGYVLEDPSSFLEFCKDYFRDKADHYEKVVAMHRVDLEAQAIHDCANYVVKSLKNAKDEQEET